MGTECVQYPQTWKVLQNLKEKLKCSECAQVAQSPVTLGGCEHIFCSGCSEKHLGDICPVCNIPGHVKDAQVNRQLFNLVVLSQQLEDVLLGKSEEDSPPTGGSCATTSSSIAPKSSSSTSEQKMPVYDFESPSNTTAQDRTKSSPSLPNLTTSMNRLKPKGRHETKISPKSTKTNLANQTTMSQFFDYIDDEEDEFQIEDIPTESDEQQKDVENGRTDCRRDEVCIEVGESDTRTEKGKGSDTIEEVESDEKVKVGAQKVKIAGRKSKTKQTGQKRRGSAQFKQKGKNLRVRALSKSMNEVDFSECRISDDDSDATVEGGVEEKQRKTIKARRRHSLGVAAEAEGGGEVHVKAPKKSDPVSISHRLTEAEEVKVDDAKAKNQKRRSLNSSLTSSNKKNSQNLLDKKNAKGETALQVACIKGDLEKVKELLEQGANPNTKDNAGWTPLHEACHHGHLRIAEILLDKGALIDVPGTDNDTPLHDAICQGRVECVRLLVSRGASLHVRNAKGWTPSDLALTEEMIAALETPVTHPTHQPMDLDVPLQQSLCFLSTGLSREQKGLLQKCAGLLHAQVVEEFSPLVTHVITSVNSEGVCPRTIKYLQAVLTGKWIVNMEWVSMCLEYEDRVCEEAFEVPGSSFAPDSLAPQRGRLNSQKQFPGLFDGCQFYFHGSFQYPTPNREDLIGLVKLGGGKILIREPKPGHIQDSDLTTPYHAKRDGAVCCIYIVHDNNSGFGPIKTPVMSSVKASWVMDCIAKFDLLSTGEA